MASIELLTADLWKRAREVYGDSHCVAASISFNRRHNYHAVQAFWQAHICLTGRSSIFCDGQTPEEALDAAMAKMLADCPKNVAAVLGISVAEVA